MFSLLSTPAMESENNAILTEIVPDYVDRDTGTLRLPPATPEQLEFLEKTCDKIQPPAKLVDWSIAPNSLQGQPQK